MNQPAGSSREPEGANSMGDYTEHLISLAGGDGDVHAEGRALVANIHERKRKATMPDLDAIQARADAATEGPWEAGTLGGHAADVFTVASDEDLGRLVICEHAGTDAEFIAAARTDVPALLAVVRSQQAKIERVLELHTFAHTDVEPWAMGYRYSGDHCGFDGEHWPCATVAALTATEGA